MSHDDDIEKLNRAGSAEQPGAAADAAMLALARANRTRCEPGARRRDRVARTDRGGSRQRTGSCRAGNLSRRHFGKTGCIVRSGTSACCPRRVG